MTTTAPLTQLAARCQPTMSLKTLALNFLRTQPFILMQNVQVIKELILLFEGILTQKKCIKIIF